MFEKLFGKEQKTEDMPVSAEELKALGIPDNVSMTRSELDRHMATLGRRKALGEDHSEGEMPVLTDEEIEKAEEALHKNQEMGK